MSILELGFFSGDIRFRLLNDAGETAIREVIFDWIRKTEGVAYTGTISDAAFDAASNVLAVNFPAAFENVPYMEFWLEATDGSQVTDVKIAGITDVVILPGTSIPANTLVQKGFILDSVNTAGFIVKRLGVFRGSNTGGGPPYVTFGQLTAIKYVTDNGFTAPLTNTPNHSVRWLAYYRD